VLDHEERYFGLDHTPDDFLRDLAERAG